MIRGVYVSVGYREIEYIDKDRKREIDRQIVRDKDKERNEGRESTQQKGRK